MGGQRDYVRVSATIPRKEEKEERNLMYSSAVFREAQNDEITTAKKMTKRRYTYTIIIT